jgi:SAM-dependent MidA family methyltransferase
MPVLEERRPFVDSLLWRVPREYYRDRGIRAWTSGDVPHYITNNPVVANAYARLFSSWLEDCRPTLDPSHPVYVLELGAGSGRFAHLFLTALHPRERAAVRYVVSDTSEANLDFVRSNPANRPWFATGTMDIAHFDVVTSESAELRLSGERLATASVRNPLFVVANYCFDSVPSHCFHLRDGRIYEALVTVVAPDAGSCHPSQFQVTFHLRLAPGNCLVDPALDRLLDEYRSGFPGVTLLLPAAAIGCLRRLGEWCPGGLLALVADKGYVRAESLQHAEMPEIDFHGDTCLSMPLNFHAIRRFVEGLGGEALETSHGEGVIHFAAYRLGDADDRFARTRSSFVAAFEESGPDDLYCLLCRAVESVGAMTLPEALACLRISRWDPWLWQRLYPVLRRELRRAPIELQQQAAAAIPRVLANHYPLGEDNETVAQCEELKRIITRLA